ncbi:MAG: metallophosphoesterase [Thermoleophilaceae bacterium]|nr:metallophosphoesterase [Thermoleophilaceae bacterium]
MNFSGRTAGSIALAAMTLVVAGVAGCGSTDAPAATSSSAQSALPAAKATARPVIAALGDIACRSDAPVTATTCQHQAVADAITRIKPESVWLLGDIQYQTGELVQFQNSFGKSFAALKNRWRPTPGNHEYFTPGAGGYFDFFGRAAGPARRGYYSFNIGSWHVVSLNANCSVVDCTSSSAQARWLRDDLKKNPSRCTAGIWHQPLFSSGEMHGNDPLVRPLWKILQSKKADLVLNGHDHDFETFVRQDANGKRDPNGMIEMVVGAGGKSFYDFAGAKPNSRVRITNAFGFLKLRLNRRSFDWSYVSKDSEVLARGSARCV